MADPFDPVKLGLNPLYGNAGLDQSTGTGQNAQWVQGAQTGWAKQDGNNYTNWDLAGKITDQGTNSVNTIAGEALRNFALLAGGGMALNSIYGVGGLGGAGVGTTAGTGAYVGEGALSGIIPGVAEGTVAGATTAGATGLAGTLAGAAAPVAAGAGGLGSLASLASIGSGLYGMYKANQLTDQAQTNADKAAPWTSGVVTPGSGQQVAGDALKNVISGDFSNDAGFKLAQLSAARTSAQQPGGYSASAAANAAIKYQNDRILALSAPAGVGYNPNATAATQGTQAANTLAGQSLGSIGFGLSGAGAVSPQLQALLLKYGLV